jgi:hypothetical protein
MTKQSSLFLYEEVMLLALRDEEGTIASGTMYQYAIGAAILAELLLNKRRILNIVQRNNYATAAFSGPQKNLFCYYLRERYIQKSIRYQNRN